MSVEESARLYPRDPIDCGHCGRELYDGRGRLKVKSRSNKLGKTYVRRTELKSETGWVHYGMMERLEKQGYQIPKNFRGNSHALALAIGMKHEDLARLWKMSTQDLRAQGTFTLSE